MERFQTDRPISKHCSRVILTMSPPDAAGPCGGRARHPTSRKLASKHVRVEGLTTSRPDYSHSTVIRSAGGSRYLVDALIVTRDTINRSNAFRSDPDASAHTASNASPA